MGDLRNYCVSTASGKICKLRIVWTVNEHLAWNAPLRIVRPCRMLTVIIIIFIKSGSWSSTLSFSFLYEKIVLYTLLAKRLKSGNSCGGREIQVRKANWWIPAFPSSGEGGTCWVPILPMRKGRVTCPRVSLKSHSHSCLLRVGLEPRGFLWSSCRRN